MEFLDSTPSASPLGLEGRSILVVEDEPEIASFMARVLVRSGHTVRVAGDGCDALRQLQQSVPDIILCDMKMPHMSGDEFYSELTRLWPLLPQRTLFVTGNVMDPSVASFLERVGRPRLVKPFGAAELADAVNSFFR